MDQITIYKDDSIVLSDNNSGKEIKCWYVIAQDKLGCEIAKEGPLYFHLVMLVAADLCFKCFQGKVKIEFLASKKERQELEAQIEERKERLNKACDEFINNQE